MSGLRIAFFGSSLVSAYWNGAATYYRGIIRALADRGHHVTFYEPDMHDRQAHRDIENPEWARMMVYAAEESALERALEDAKDCDLLVKTSGVGKFDDLLEAAVLDMRSPHTIAAFWDVNAPATLERLHANRDDPFHALIPRYDLILTYGGGARVVEAYARLGARACVPIYNALDPKTHHPVRMEPRFGADLGLLANRLPDREERVEKFFLRAAKEAPGRKFLLGGSGWQDKAVPPNVKVLGHVFTWDHNAFNSSVRAVLNVNRESMAAHGSSPPTRIFEAAGAAACIISDAWEGIDFFLEPGREVLVAEGGLEVASLLLGLTAPRARKIGAAAYRRVMARHTYKHRVAQLEEVLGVGHRHAMVASGLQVSGAALAG